MGKRKIDVCFFSAVYASSPIFIVVLSKARGQALNSRLCYTIVASDYS